MKEQQMVWVVSDINEKKLKPLKMDVVTDVGGLPEQAPFAVILSKNDRQDWVEMLRSLRATEAYRYTPVFYHGDVEADFHHLFDGPADDHLKNRAVSIHERLALVDDKWKSLSDDESILLTYLYSRTDMRLKGRINHRSPYAIEFPLLTVLFGKAPAFDAWRFLQGLHTRNLLVAEALIGEIETCTACDSGLLNMKKSCPYCKSIDIKLQKFVHCFSCGKIGPVPELLRQDRLLCSRCNTMLREEGVDYEKPREDKLCNACDHVFSESDVTVQCLVCHRNALPHEMGSRRLYDYVLTLHAEYLVRGVKKSIFRNFKQYFNVTAFPAFMATIAWQAKLAARYSSIYFSVLTLKIESKRDLIALKGEVHSERLLGQLFISLRQIFRESDLASRQEDLMCFLLPMANQDGSQVVVNRIITAVQQLTEEEIGKGLRVSISHITSEEIIKDALQGDTLIEALMNRTVDCRVGMVEQQSPL